MYGEALFFRKAEVWLFYKGWGPRMMYCDLLPMIPIPMADRKFRAHFVPVDHVAMLDYWKK